MYSTRKVAFGYMGVGVEGRPRRRASWLASCGWELLAGTFWEMLEGREREIRI